MTSRDLGLVGPFLGSAAVADGLVTARQLRGAQVQRLFRGVYVPAGTHVDHRVRAEAATLLLPPSAAISGRSAAEVHDVGLAERDDPVEVSVPEHERFGPVRGLLVTRTSLRSGDSRPWLEARLTTPVRTAFDLARSRRGPAALADVDAFLRATGLTPAQVLAELHGRHNHGVVGARQVLALADPRAESRPESVVRFHLNQADLWPELQHAIRLPDGTRVRFDLAFPTARVAVEHDGEWHALREQLGRDRARLNAVRRAGWRVVHVSAATLARGPAPLVAEVRDALAVTRSAA